MTTKPDADLAQTEIISHRELLLQTLISEKDQAIAALRERLSEFEKDKYRMDWLEARELQSSVDDDGRCTLKISFYSYTSADGDHEVKSIPVPCGDTLRGIVDEAQDFEMDAYGGGD